MPVLRGDLTVRAGRLDAPQSASGLAQSKTLRAGRERGRSRQRLGRRWSATALGGQLQGWVRFQHGLCRSNPSGIGRDARRYNRTPSPPGCLGDKPFILLITDHPGNGAAEFSRTRKVPKIRKIPALLWFDRLHGAVFAVEENAFSIRLVRKGKSPPILGQPGELLDKFWLCHSLAGRQPGDFRLGQTHLPRPATAGRATLTLQKNWHAGSLSKAGLRRNLAPNHSGVSEERRIFAPLKRT